VTPKVDAQAETNWQVLIIGGSSGVGKTLIAQRLAKQAGSLVLPGDDIRLAVQEITTPITHPDIHIFSQSPNFREWPAEVIRDGLIKVARALTPAFEIIVKHHCKARGEGKIVLEGDILLPGFVKSMQAEISKDAVRGIFLYEKDERVLLNNTLTRSRGIEQFPLEQQQNMGRMSWLYGEWLREEAEGYGLPVITTQPFDNLAERILSKI
jgi:2-phosphoglycerate kinase